MSVLEVWVGVEGLTGGVKGVLAMNREVIEVFLLKGRPRGGGAL